MKKVLCIILGIMMLLTAACALAEGTGDKPWPTRAIKGTGALTWTSNMDPEFWAQSFFGPNKSYASGGAYKVEKIVKMEALFREGTFVYVDVQSSTVSRRCVYFQKGMLFNSNVEELTLQGVPATVSADIVPRLGPGEGYAAFSKGNLAGGTAVTALFETDDGWLFAEFESPVGKVRAWLPADQVKAD